MPDRPQLEIVPLGGVGEFGLNMTVYRQGGDCLVVDAGMMFPAGNLPGVDYVVPDLAYLHEAGQLRGIVLTHGHEDHYGALSFLLRHFDAPVWGSPYTLALVRERLRQHGFERAVDLRPLPDSPARADIGPFAVEAITVAHSIPQCRLLAIAAGAGVVVHSGDLKLDTAPPDGDATDLERLAALGGAGVLALLSDSTNAPRRGSTGGEATVEPAVDALLASASGRVLLTTFSSNIQRLALLGRLAERHDRRLALLGAAVNQHAEIAQQLGLLTWPQGVRIPAEQLSDLPPSCQLAVAGGSQGETLSAMSRIAAGQHRDLQIEPGDTVIHSARVIPGNEKPIDLMLGRMRRLGARVITADDEPVHVSGHASSDELQRLIELLRPRCFVPVHGTYDQLAAHAQLAAAAGVAATGILTAKNGDRIAPSPGGVAVVGEAPVGRVYIEGPGDEIAWDLIRERRKCANDGVVVAVVEIDPQTGIAKGYPDVVGRGFVPGFDPGGEMLELARETIAAALEEAPFRERREPEALAERIQAHLRRTIRRHSGRQPLVIARVRHV